MLRRQMTSLRAALNATNKQGWFSTSTFESHVVEFPLLHPEEIPPASNCSPLHSLWCFHCPLTNVKQAFFFNQQPFCCVYIWHAWNVPGLFWSLFLGGGWTSAIVAYRLPVQSCHSRSGQTGTRNVSSEFDLLPLLQQHFLWTCMTSGGADWVSSKKKLSIKSHPPWKGPEAAVPCRGLLRTPLHLQQGQTMGKMTLNYSRRRRQRWGHIK